MEEKGRQTLKTYFETGDTPTSEQFSELIDSSLNKKEDQIAVENGNIGFGVGEPINKLDVAGSLAVGISYAGKHMLDQNDLAVQGKLGIGTPPYRYTIRRMWDGLMLRER